MMANLKLEVLPEELRTMLRIRHDKLDSELMQLKDAYLSDLAMCGVQILPSDVSLVKACLRLYLRWQENYNGEAERYKGAYEGMKIAMSLAEEYKEKNEE
ncbi:MAG: hypothetical protein ACLSAC_23295 [Enterocloster bolteae]|uniref:hypothetical protein n=1 Tax=Enterocloster bolteae TaxID=208479 RepID=UPI00210B6455|nr:hypothetical protein [Enterocloster bolteae]MCQ4758978.1 hypothetical protein [Enterocloster bolteae]